MFIKRKSSTTLAIIGNGFDLAHNYETSFESFKNHTVSESLEIFKRYCEKETHIKKWYDFENNINLISEKLFIESMSDSSDTDYEAIRNDTLKLNNIFSDIHFLLIDYLKKQTETKTPTIMPTVRKYITPHTHVINFNYTNIAEFYSKKVFYVHGSIKENDIILGYDYRDEPCVAQFDDIKWSKILCRQRLTFRRFLINKKHILPETHKFKELLKSFEIYQSCLSNEGIHPDTQANSYIPNYNFIKNFMKRYKDNMSICPPNINYNKITTLVILGHGIEADKEFLNEIINNCKNLSKIVIFRYDGESDYSFDKKVDFFKRYTNNIVTTFY